MNKKFKYPGILLVLLAVVFLITACSPVQTEILDPNYDLDLEVVGDGVIRDANDNIITSSQRTLEISRNSTVEITAESFDISDFLFWTGNTPNIFDETQSIYMDSNKEIMVVFGDPDDIFMAGYVSESWGSNDVIGYWKALLGYPHLEVYVRETSGTARAERFIFNEGGDEYDEEEVVYYQPAGEIANSEFIAALKRVEESNNLEVDEDRFVFVYIDRKGFNSLILEDNEGNLETYNEIIDVLENEGQEEFGRRINQLIDDNRNKDIIIGSTVNIYDQVIN